MERLSQPHATPVHYGPTLRWVAVVLATARVGSGTWQAASSAALCRALCHSASRRARRVSSTRRLDFSSLPPSFAWIGKASLGGFPVIVLLTLLLVIFFDLAVRHTRFFRQVYFIGANEKAAILSGIHVDRVRITLYALTGVLAALAGVLLASRLMSGTPTAGNGIELQVLAAAVIGGASLRGGEGTILGAFLGVVFVALINNTMTMLAVSIYWQMIVIGGVLVAAVALDMLIRSKRG